MSKKSFIDSVEVGKPCSEDWEKMKGNARFRFCSHCTKHVSNLSEMTRKEAMRFVRASGGNICIRYIQDPVTKRPLFAEQLFQITRRAPGLAAGVMTASMSLSALIYAQDQRTVESTSDPIKLSTPVNSEGSNKGKANKSKPASLRTGQIEGTVKDIQGAVVPGVTVKLIGENERLTTSTNDDGHFSFADVEPGAFTLNFDSVGFKRNVVSSVKVFEGQTAVQNTTLEIGQLVSLGGVMASVEYSLPLSKAVADENIEEIRDLIINGANVNSKDENYSQITPLFVAVEHGNVEIVQILLNFGAKINARDKDKQTPLMRLDDDATPELAELLLQGGAKVNLTDREGNTALIITAESVKPEVLRKLIAAGPDINVSNNYGQTALMNAAHGGQLENVRMLLLAGAEVNAKNKDGETASELTSDEEIENLLVSFGAEVKETVAEMPGGYQQR